MRLSLAELTDGRRFVGHGRTLTETDHNLFMMLVGDWHPIHADETYARTTPLGRRVMHGSLGVALAMGMMTNLFEHAEPILGALGLEEWKYLAPLTIGATVHVELEILGTRITSAGDRAVVSRRISLVDENGTVLQTGRSAVMLRVTPLPGGD